MLPSLRPLLAASLLVFATAAACAPPPTSPDPGPGPVVPLPAPAPEPPPPPPPTPTLAITRFMAFGDSLTEGEWWPGLEFYDPAFSNAYPTFVLHALQERYPTQTFVMVNEGLGGYRAAADAKDRFVEALDQHAPEAVLLLDGVNDLYDDPTSTGIAAVVDALRTDIEHAKSRNAWVFLSTITAERDPNPGGVDDPGFKERHWLPDSLIVQANAAIRTLASGEGVTLIDGYAITAANPNAMIGADGLHLTIDGYKALGDAFFEAIRAKFEPPSAPSPAAVRRTARAGAPGTAPTR